VGRPQALNHRNPRMDVSEENPTTARPLNDPEAEVVAYLVGRSVPCPRCAYDLRDLRSARCPECGEPLVLKIGSQKARFGWLVVAMAPGFFSGVAALFVLIPIFGTLWAGNRQNLPWPLVAADAFGFLSIASVGLMYRHRHRFMSWTLRRQGAFAGAVWGVHILAFGLFLLAMWLWK
jgi:NADH:ubiquinone oxidoreductase subunit 3 (subunit A)